MTTRFSDPKKDNLPTFQRNIDMNTSYRLTVLLASTCLFALTACTSITPTTSTLGSPTALKSSADGSKRFLRKPLPLQSEIYLSEIAVNLVNGATDHTTPADEAELVAELRNQLDISLRETYKVVDKPTDRSMALRAVITEIRTSSVAGNVVSTLFLGMPADKGGAAVEFELTSASGERVAALAVAAQGKFMQFEGAFSKLGQAKLVMAQHAKSLADLLQGS
jgi:hypothetical protein